MNAAEVKIALRWHVGNICRDLSLLAELPYGGRGSRIVDGYQDHLGTVEVGGFEDSVDVCDLALSDAVGHLIIETGRGTYDMDIGIGVETVEDAARSDL